MGQKEALLPFMQKGFFITVTGSSLVTAICTVKNLEPPSP
ncbi:hypothetical protein HMPREF9374_3598 [Desmospora sp. 8437]|nr:hypothetical protein HMPREF9374_3598 [Desmospora sp. 8437]